MNRQITWKEAKNEILGSSKWIVTLDENDMNTFEAQDDDLIQVLESTTRDSSEERFSILSQIIDSKVSAGTFESITKIIIFIQFPISNPITMEEMGAVNLLVDKLIQVGRDCEVKWGLSPREDDITRIVCAIR